MLAIGKNSLESGSKIKIVHENCTFEVQIMNWQSRPGIFFASFWNQHWEIFIAHNIELSCNGYGSSIPINMNEGGDDPN